MTQQASTSQSAIDKLVARIRNVFRPTTAVTLYPVTNNQDNTLPPEEDIERGTEAETAVTPSPISQISKASQQRAIERIAAELGRRWARLHGSEEDAGETIVPSEPAWLHLLTPIRYIFSLITLGLVFYSFWGMNSSDANYRQEQIRLFLSACGLLLGIISTLWAETRARQKMLNQQVMGSLAVLGRHNQEQADHLLRAQTLDELDGLAGTLKDVRFKLIRTHETTAVAQIKAMELHTKRLKSKFGRANSTQAAYLHGTRMTGTELAALYNYDESLLLQLNHITDSAQTLLAGAVLAGRINAAVPSLAAELTEFEHRFRARARFIRTPLADG